MFSRDFPERVWSTWQVPGIVTSSSEMVGLRCAATCVRACIFCCALLDGEKPLQKIQGRMQWRNEMAVLDYINVLWKQGNQ